MKEITPEQFRCHTSSCCPAVYQKQDGSYVIVGKKLNVNDLQQVADRVGDDEYVVEIPKGLLEDLLLDRAAQ